MADQKDAPSWIDATFAAVVLAAVTASYLPDLGRGFIRDDFAWILGSRHDGSLDGWLDLLRRHNGFYRPIVAVAFAVNDRVFGLEPFWFGLTNLLLVFGCMAGLVQLGLALGLTRRAALAAAAIWGLNPHGIGGAILWISGRTSLLLTLFAILAAIAAVRRRWVLLSLFYSLALFSKEEAVLLPAVLVIIVFSGSADRRRDVATAIAAVMLPLVVYFALRSQTAAFLPGSAPSYYRFVSDPLALGRNVLEYLDRTITFPSVVVLVVWMIARRRPSFHADDRRRLTIGILWVCLSFGLTVFLPVRSSLYVCLPLVGAALVAATLAEALARREPSFASLRALGVAAVAISIVMIPIHRSRNVRLRKMAELSASVFSDLAMTSAPLSEGKGVVLHDAVGQRYNIEKAFGTLIGDAMRLRTGLQAAALWVDPPIEGFEAAGLAPVEGRPLAHFWLRDGRLVALDPPSSR